MKRFFIEDARFDLTDTEMVAGCFPGVCVGEVKVKASDGEEFYLTLCDGMGCPTFYKTKDSILDDLLPIGENEGIFEELEEFNLGIKSYHKALDRKEDELYELYRYLIFLVDS